MIAVLGFAVWFFGFSGSEMSIMWLPPLHVFEPTACRTLAAGSMPIVWMLPIWS